MAAPVHTTDDYAAKLLELLPRGRAWPREPGTTIGQVMQGLAASLARVDADAGHLLVAAFPATATDLLPEWEQTLGLPRDGMPVTDLALRQSAVAGALAGHGGQSIAYFTGIALAIGLEIEITQFTPTSVADDVNAPIYDNSWAFVWQVYGITDADYTVLRVLFDLFKPAHTIILWRVPHGDLLQESGDLLLLENGGHIMLDY